MNLFENLTTRQKQLFTASCIVVAGVAVVIAISAALDSARDRNAGKGVVHTKKMSLLSEKVEKDLWVAAEGQNIKALEKSNEELRAQIVKIQKEMEETKETAKKARKVESYPAVPPPLPVRKSSVAAGVGPATFPPNAPQISGSLPQPQSLPAAESPRQKFDAGSSIKVFKDDAKVKQDDKAMARKDKPEPGTWLPSGSFMKAVLLSGLDAPTSGGSPAEPYPVLMGITDLGVLPNRYRMNLKECFVIGAGYGNLSDERAYIRTETLSCVRNDRKVIDVSLKGHVMGEDGKLGLRGRLVSKQGQQIAMAIFAGTLSGLGTALKPQHSVSINLSDNAGLNRYDWGDVMESAAMGGASNALGKVADYYLKMAERLFPIVEIDAGRHVDVVVLKGQELKIAASPKS